MGGMEFGYPDKQELSADPSFEEAIDWYVGSVSNTLWKVNDSESIQRAWQTISGQSEMGEEFSNPFVEGFKKSPHWQSGVGYQGLEYLRPVVDVISLGGAKSTEDKIEKGAKLAYLADVINNRNSRFMGYDIRDSRSRDRKGDELVLSTLKESIIGLDGFPYERRMNALIEYCELDLGMGRQPQVALKKVGRKVLELIG